MKSRNFEILRGAWPELAALGGFAEAYAHDDPASALVKLRLFAENLTKDIYRDLGLPKPEHATFVDLLGNQSFAAITPRVVLDKLHALRIHGNKAAHGDTLGRAAQHHPRGLRKPRSRAPDPGSGTGELSRLDPHLRDPGAGPLPSEAQRRRQHRLGRGGPWSPRRARA
jgi:Domain of unknown function (DUF4145)